MVREFVTRLEQRFRLRESISRRLRNQRLVRDTGLLMFANAIVVGLGLIRTPAMTWMLPKDEVGMLGVVASWLPFLQLVSLSGLDTAAYHYVAKGQPAAFARNALYRLRWSLLSTAGFLLGAAYWAYQGNPLLAWVFAITGLSYPVTIGMTASAGMLSAQENFKGLFWYRIWESLTDFTGFIPLLFSVWWVSKVITFYTANQFATAIMQVGVTLWLVRKTQQAGAPPLPKEDEREMVRYGRHLTAISGISVLQGRTDALLVGILTPLSTVADYSIAQLVSEQFRRLWNVYISLRYPPLVRMDVRRRRRRMFLEGAIIMVGFVGLGLLVSLLGHFLIPRILPPVYSTSLGYMDILIATTVIGTPGGLAEIFFRTEQDEKRQYAMRIIGAIMGVVFPVLLISPFGAYGAAFGRLIANLVFSIYGVFLVAKHPLPQAPS